MTLRRSEHANELGQPIGRPLPGWETRPTPPRTPIVGRLCRIEPLSAGAHAAALHEAYTEDRDGSGWTYLPYGPFESADAYAEWVRRAEVQTDTIFYAIVDAASGRPVGVASYLRIAPDMGSIEVGHLRYAPALQQTAASTEAMYLMMRRAFDELGYRRYEWKCDSLNAPSRAAALRLGFQYEGLFRDAVVYKGRSRDNAWYSIVADEWPALRTAFERWLDPANFGADGRQQKRLAECIAEAQA
jgi:RimJ/RimL family protein N-acetyltransferase